MYGVGSRLISSHGHPALGGVFKLVAIDNGGWTPAIKISDTPAKMPIPGRKNLWRVYDKRGLATADVVSREDVIIAAGRGIDVHHPHRPSITRTRATGEVAEVEPLHSTVFTDGKRTNDQEPLDVMRGRRDADLARLDIGVRRLVNPHRYHVSVTTPVRDLQVELVDKTKATS
jgi:nicotinate phosphoribosyltransferase